MSLSTLAADLGALCEAKQAAYGRSVGKAARILAVLYPNGVQPSQYIEFVTTSRILDKLSRLSQGADPMGESPFIDIAGHALVAMDELNQEIGTKVPCATASTAPAQSKASADSASAPATRPTRENASAPSEPSRPSGISAPSRPISESTVAPAPTATELVSRVEAALERVEALNRLGLCAICEQELKAPIDVRQYIGLPGKTYAVCSRCSSQGMVL